MTQKRVIIGLLLTCCLIVVTLKLSRCDVESFTPIDNGKRQGSKRDYVEEISHMSAYIGPFIGEVYADLRVRYMDPTNPPPLAFIPEKNSEILLLDTTLPAVRKSIVAWIDSFKTSMEQRYEPEILEEMVPKWDITYEKIQMGNTNRLTQRATEILRVTYTEESQPHEYYI